MKYGSRDIALLIKYSNWSSCPFSSDKLAKLKYLPNNFKILEEGDHVICAISGKKIYLDQLTYWNVELQEPYFSYKEAFLKNESIIKSK